VAAPSAGSNGYEAFHDRLRRGQSDTLSQGHDLASRAQSHHARAKIAGRQLLPPPMVQVKPVMEPADGGEEVTSYF